MIENKSLPIFGVVIAIGLIISTYIVSLSIKDVKMSHQIIKVRGYAEKQVKADFTIWEMKIKKKAKTINDGYSNIEKDSKKIVEYLIQTGVTKKEIKQSPISITEVYLKDNQGNRSNVIDYYNFSLKLETRTNKIDTISALSIKIDSPIKEKKIQSTSIQRPLYILSMEV